MRTSKTIAERYASVMSLLNPFGVVDCNGDVMVFTNSVEAYTTVIIRMWSMFPKGYVDLVLFGVEVLGLRHAVAVSVVGRKQYARVDWCSKTRTRNGILKAILIQLLRATKITFSENSFNAAIFNFDKFLDKQNVQAKTINGTLTSFIKHAGRKENPTWDKKQ